MSGNALRQMRSAFRLALHRQRQSRRAVAQALRQGLREHRAAVIASVQSALAPAAPATTIDLDARVLTAIERHADGVRALDLGNELGLDWRRVLHSTSHLVAAGLIDQVDQEFYAVRKASRT